MGARILELMRAHAIRNNAKFADRIGLSRQTFHAWLYKEMKAENVAALPLLKCAAELGTNALYLLGETDDLRVAHALDYSEAQLVQAYRDMDERDREKMLKNAADWVAQSKRAPSRSAPFRILTPQGETK